MSKVVDIREMISLILKEEYKCLYCRKPTNRLRSEIEYNLVIPEEIAPKDGLEHLYANQYKYGHHKFCDWKCYNLKVLDNAIDGLSYSLQFPEDHFLPLHINKDIEKAKVTLSKLKEFKEKLLK